MKTEKDDLLVTDHIDYAAEYLRGFREKERMLENDFPWVGFAIGLFQHLAARGFVMKSRVN